MTGLREEMRELRDACEGAATAPQLHIEARIAYALVRRWISRILAAHPEPSDADVAAIRGIADGMLATTSMNPRERALVEVGIREGFGAGLNRGRTKEGERGRA